MSDAGDGFEFDGLKADKISRNAGIYAGQKAEIQCKRDVKTC
jgi:hypothetical protein